MANPSSLALAGPKDAGGGRGRSDRFRALDEDDRAAHRSRHGAARGEGAGVDAARLLGESILDDADNPGLPQHDEGRIFPVRAAPETKEAQVARRRIEEKIREKREADRLKTGFYLEERPREETQPENEADEEEGEGDEG